MATMKLTVIGLENYQNSRNMSIFDKLRLPEGIDKDELVNDILLTAGEFEVLYADADFFTDAVGIWSRRYYKTFDKWAKALELEYNPLDNYDRTEEYTDTVLSTGNTNTSTSGSDSRSIQNNTSAYDEAGYSPDTQTSDTGSNQQTADSSAVGNTETTHRARIHGNIGVTTSMQLIQSELELAEWSLYKHITDLFIQELCLAVY